ncbi:hypothetical protein [Streptomyces coerulescens]|uniref:Uncharacterized protein n=1 Tax=Streptomyces coerulescens TaxID=29304 RepID=A0ABW0CX93_STRCD
MKLRLRAAVGDAVLIHPKGKPDQRAVGFAEGLARDVHNTLVVVDLPPGAVDREWESVARLLAPARYGSLRLVFGRGTREEIRTAGRRIADRLGREVLVPDGPVVPTVVGGLFVPGDRGDGWLRCRPGRPAERDSQRFPKPHWEFSLPARPMPTGTHTVAEPVPGGVWVRDTRADPSAAQRRRVVEDLPARPDVLLVIVGGPGAPAVGLDDLARFWDTVLPNARPSVRFAMYGTLDVPAAVAPGQGLADALGEPVVLYAGLPAGPRGAEEIRVYGGDTMPGWRPYAEELRYVPVRGGQAPPPVLAGLRPPLAEVPEIAAGLYEYASDTVLEVVQSGLWLRSRTEPSGADAVRRAPAATGHVTLHVDRGSQETADRMRALAEDLRRRLHAETGAAIVLAPADEQPGLAAGEAAHGLAAAWGDGLDGGPPAALASPAERTAPPPEQRAPLRPSPAPEAGALTSAALPPQRTHTESGALSSPAPRIRGDVPTPPDGVLVDPVVGVPPVRGGVPTTLDGVLVDPVVGVPPVRGGVPTTPDGVLVDPALRVPAVRGGTRRSGPSGDPPVPPATEPAGRPGPADPVSPRTEPAARPGRADPVLPTTEPVALPRPARIGERRPLPVDPMPPAPDGGGPTAAPPVPSATEPAASPRRAGPDPAFGGVATAPFARTRHAAGRGPSGGSDVTARLEEPTAGDTSTAPGAAEASDHDAAARPGLAEAGPASEDAASAAPQTGRTPDPVSAPAARAQLSGTAERLLPPAPAAGVPERVSAPAAPAQLSETAERLLPPAPTAGVPDPVPAPAAPAQFSETAEQTLQPPSTAGVPEPSAADVAVGAPAPRPGRPSTAIPARPAASGFRLESAAPEEAAAPPAPAPASPARTGVSVQPTPKAAACALPPERGVGQERDWVRRTFSEQYNAAAGVVARVISESPGLRGGSKSEAAEALTELVAVRLYLSGDHRRADDAVRAAAAGPHVPLARCVTAGLRRLPSYRGPALLRSRLGAAERAWYREGRLATEWAFCHARTVLHEGPRGGTDFLIWSMTARRTSQLDPAVADRVLFLPGTSFKVLRTEGTTVLLRELSPSEIAEDGRVEVQRGKLDTIALQGLQKILDALEKAGTDDRAESADPPGLIVARRKEGAKS